MFTFDQRLIGDESTLAFGALLGRNLRSGDRLFLHGPLGAGKTTLVRGLMHGLEHPDSREVASPTFAIHHRYDGGRLSVDHLDLYRLTAPVDLAAEGLDTVIDDPSSVVVIEWPERLQIGSLSPTISIHLTLLGEGSRGMRLTGRDGLESIRQSTSVLR